MNAMAKSFFFLMHLECLCFWEWKRQAPRSWLLSNRETRLGMTKLADAADTRTAAGPPPLSFPCCTRSRNNVKLIFS